MKMIFLRQGQAGRKAKYVHAMPSSQQELIMSLIMQTKHQNKPCKGSTATHNTNRMENDKHSILNITAFYKS